MSKLSEVRFNVLHNTPSDYVKALFAGGLAFATGLVAVLPDGVTAAEWSVVASATLAAAAAALGFYAKGDEPLPEPEPAPVESPTVIEVVSLEETSDATLDVAPFEDETELPVPETAEENDEDVLDETVDVDVDPFLDETSGSTGIQEETTDGESK